MILFLNVVHSLVAHANEKTTNYLEKPEKNYGGGSAEPFPKEMVSRRNVSVIFYLKERFYSLSSPLLPISRSTKGLSLKSCFFWSQKPKSAS